MTLSLSKKVILLVSLMLVSELAIVGALAVLQSDAEREAARAGRSTAITEAINIISRELYGLLSRLQVKSFTPEFVKSGELTRFRESLKEQYRVLEAETRSVPAEQSIVAASEKAADEGLVMLGKLEHDPLELAKLNDLETCRQFLRDLKSKGRAILSDEFINLNHKEKTIARASPGKQASIRSKQKATLWAALILNIVLSLAAAFWLVRGITSRLKVLTDNAHRFSAKQDLNPLMSGSDEIAGLDKTFHDMASNILEANRKERAVVDKARDIICTIDSDLRFSNLNPVAEQIFLCPKDEIVGRKFTEFLHSSDVDSALDAAEEAMQGKENADLELRIRRANGEMLDTIWTMHWSSTDKSFFCVVHDDSARKQAERMRQEFIAMLTHDLKAPLSFIGNFLEMLEAEQLGTLNQDGKKLLSMAESASGQMRKLINDMLDLEKARAGMLELKVEKLAFDKVLESSCALMQELASKRNIKIELSSCPSIVTADKNTIERVLANLLSNAIKFSPDNSVVDVRAEESGGRVKVSVKDQGPGIEANKLAEIFDRYTQVHDKEERAIEGSGLGLSICKVFVNLNGGSIKAESSPGNGTTVSFDLPTTGTGL